MKSIRPNPATWFSARLASRAGSTILCLMLFIPFQDDPLPIDTGIIPTGTWRYRAISGGMQTGELISAVRRERTQIVSTSDLRGSFIQRGNITVDETTLRPVRSSTFIYEPGEGTTTASLTYTDHGDSLLVEGTVSWSSISQPRTLLEIERTISRMNHYDNQTIDLIIASLPLESGQAWRVHIFEPTTFHEVIPVTIDVRGKSRIETPAGEFEAWRIEVRGFGHPVDYWIDTETRVLLVQHVRGRDLRFELISDMRPESGGRTGEY